MSEKTHVIVNKARNKYKAPIPIYVSWTEDLMEDDVRSRWEQYKASLEDTKGKQPREIARIKQTPMAIHLRNWVNANKIGHNPVQEEVEKGGNVNLASGPPPEYKFVLKPGINYVTEDQAKHFMHKQGDSWKSVNESGQEMGFMDIMEKFEYEEDYKFKDEYKEYTNEEVDPTEMPWKELREYASEKGVKVVGVNRKQIIEELAKESVKKNK